MAKDSILLGLELVSAYAKDADSWTKVKKELLKHLSVDDRALFSRRDEITKMANVNDLERYLMQEWHSMTGRKLDV